MSAFRYEIRGIPGAGGLRRVAILASVLFRIRKPGMPKSEMPESPETAAPDDVRTVNEDPAAKPREPIPLRNLKSQSTGQDARAERLVLGLRSELGELRDALQGLRALTPQVYTLDLDALLEEPELASAIPPRIMVQELARLHDRVSGLLEDLGQREQELADLREEREALRIRLSSTEARNETLADVIAALHANLEDLRISRAYLARGEPARLKAPSKDDQS